MRFHRLLNPFARGQPEMESRSVERHVAGMVILKVSQTLVIIRSTFKTFIKSFNSIVFKVAGFGDLRNDNDPNMTYEGENNVLLQQTSNWLIAVRNGGYSAFKSSSPLESADFLADFDTLIRRKFKFSNPKEALLPESKRNHKLFHLTIDFMNQTIYRFVGGAELALCMATGSHISTRQSIEERGQEFISCSQ